MKIKYKLKPEIKEMAKLEDILTLERGRSDRKEFQTLHLYLEGNFYHLYEVSAWMFNQRIEGKYKITHTQPKNTEGSVIMIGFPQTALKKNIPLGSDVVEEENGKRVDIFLPEIMFAEDEIKSVETLMGEFTDWKSTIPLQETSGKKAERTNSLSGSHASSSQMPASVGMFTQMAGILQKIVTYTTDEHLPAEHAMFIRDLQKDAARIMF